MAVLLTSGGVIPKQVNLVNFIESSGTQCINSLFMPTENTRVEADLEFLDGNTTYNTIFGVGQTSSNQFVVYRNGANMTGQVYSTTTYTTSGVTNTGRHKCVLSNSLFQYGTYSAKVNSESFNYTYPLYIFALNSAGSVTLYAHMRLYGLKIYEGNLLVRDFVPCYDPDGVVCLYDNVNKKYYYNAGSGEFTAG